MQAFFDNFVILSESLNGPAKLRKLILYLAFRGKLAPQYIKDGTTRSLLNKIESVKLSRNGSFTKIRSLTVIGADERQHEIPHTWEWVRLGEVVDYDCAQKVTPREIASDAWLLDLEDIEKDSSRIIQKLTFADRRSKSNKGRFTIGDVLYGKLRPYLNKVVVADDDGYCTTEIVALRGYFGIEPRYLMYALKRPEFIDYINAKSYGVKMPRLGSEDARLSVFPLAPLEEQKRIVAKIDHLMRLCDQLEARQQARSESRLRLNNVTLTLLTNTALRVPQELEQASARLADNFDALYDASETVVKLRSTILQLAVQGKLVQQDPQDDPAVILLEEIMRDKARLIKQKKIKQDEPVPMTADEKLFPLPCGWEWSKLGSLCFVITDGTHYTPNYVSSGVPFLSVKDITGGKIDFTNTRFISREEHEELSQRCRPEFEDILFTKVGTTGIAKVIDVEREFSIFVSLALLKFSKEYLSPYFLELLLNSPIVRDQSRRDTQGVGNKNLVLKYIKNFVVPVPPFKEQERIVIKVNRLMTVCDELESKLRKAEADSEKLMNAAVQYVLSSTIGTRPHEKLSVRP